ncbi:MAG: hypothetical protein JW793_14200, partial [Acidobacteria bacterium]|nr:hypothetical protein [Acidobacteriota bacterium]
EVWLVSLEGERIEHRVSMNGGGQPKWKGDQKELYYLAADGSLMAVPLKGEALTPGKPEILFKTNLIPSPTTDQYAVTGDGRHFLILNSEGDAKISAFNIVLNWFEELKDLVPVD